jgi:hypothetical protein
MMGIPHTAVFDDPKGRARIMQTPDVADAGCSVVPCGIVSVGFASIEIEPIDAPVTPT